MHDSSYDPTDRFVALAETRENEAGARLLAAARELAAAVVDHFEEWEDEADAGDSLRRPGDLDHPRRLFDVALEARALAESVTFRRDLCFVLANAEAA